MQILTGNIAVETIVILTLDITEKNPRVQEHFYTLHMRTPLTALCLCALPLVVQSQLINIINNDTNICVGQQLSLQIQLSANNNVNPVTVFGPPMADDQMSANVPLNFNFTYFGNNYTTCAISTNGYIQFGTGGGGFSPWSVNAAIPSAANPTNSIMAPWGDIYPGLNGQGTVRYKTIGTAPNRIFVVEWLDNPVFSSSCSQFCYGTQIKLYETSNVIETHIANYQFCSAWNNGRAIHGIQNSNGSIAFAVPGRNFPNQWSTSNDGRRWTPNGPNSYTLSQIPFNPTFMPANVATNQITWTANGQNIGTGLTQNVSPQVNTTYIARFNYSTVCSNSFVFADTVDVTVGNLPVQSSGNQAICIGGSAQIFVQPTVPAPGVTYTWNPPTGLSATNIGNPTATPTQTTQYSVLVASPACSTTQSITVTVNPLPNVSITPASVSICPENTANLTAQGAAQYVWSPATGLSSSSIANPVADPAATTSYIVTGTDANGCVNSDTVVVTVFASPVITISPASHSMCLNDTVLLTASGAAQYAWLPAGVGGINQGNAISVSPQATQQYMVVGQDANNCVDTAVVNVTIHPLPVASFVPPGGGCVPASLTFQDNSTVASGAIVGWIWNIDGHGTFGTQNVTVGYNQPGSYGASLIALTNFGCTDTVRLDNVAFAYPNPVADFMSNPDKATIADPSFQFSDQSTGNISGWSWTFDTYGTASSPNPIFAFPGIGDFFVTLEVTTADGCTDQSTQMVSVEGISEIWIPNAFTPNGDGINETFFPVGTNLTQDVFLEVLVYNRWGDLVYEGSNPNKPWDGSCGTLTSCPVGAYSYKVTFINEKGDFREFMGRVSLVR